MKILITGKNGFVAKSLIAYLKEKGEDIITTSRYEDGTPDNFALGDLSTETQWEKALKGIDVVIHVAARVHIMKETHPNPLKAFMDANYESTRTFATKAFEAGVGKFIFLSSIFVNGCGTCGAPFEENSNIRPENDYAQSKVEAEKYLLETFKDTSMKVVILRPPMIYGYGAKGNWKSLVKLCKLPIPLPFGSIKHNKRNFIYMGNLLNFIEHILKDSLHSGIYAICDNESLSTYEFIKYIRLALGRRPWLFYVPFFKEFLKIFGLKAISDKLHGDLLIDNRKAKRDFKWNPPYTVFDGIRKSLQK